MPQNFDWQTEDEEKWDEPSLENEPRSRNSSLRRPLIIALLLAFIVVLGALLGFRQIGRYLDQATSTVEEDIIASHEIVMAATQESDKEILVSVLSGRDPSWTEMQLQLLDQVQLFDRSSIGLLWQEDNSPSDVAISLSADFKQAEVTVPQKYEVVYYENQEQIIDLQQTVVYRRSNDRWLLSPPDLDFWGDNIRVSGRFAEITFPERDEEVGRRLAADLESILAGACNQLEGLLCSGEIKLYVNLVSNPQLLIDLIDPSSRLEDGPDMFLPAPTLIGIPTDNTGYQALLRAYGERVVATFIAQSTGWKCCQHLLFYQAMLDLQLDTVGLRPWPIDSSQYKKVLENEYQLGNDSWQSDQDLAEIINNPDAWLVYILVDFIADKWSVVPTIDMQRQLMNVNDYSAWIYYVTGGNAPPSFVEEWQVFLTNRSRLSQEPRLTD